MRIPFSVSLAFHCFLIFTFVSRIIPLIGLVSIFAIILIVSNFDSFKKLEKNEIGFLILFTIIVFIMTSINTFFSLVTFFHFFISMLSLATAVVLTRSVNVYYLSSKWSLIAFQFIVVLYVLFKGLDNYPAVVPLENMVNESSANGITSYTILLQVNYAFVSYFVFKKLTFKTALITLFIALVSYGRGSILSALLILLLLTFSYIIKLKGKTIVIYFLMTFILISFITQLYWNEILFFIEANTKLSAGIVDKQRSQILNEYIEKMDLWGFFFGVDYQGTSVLNEFNSNPHNSFVRAHHIFGLPYLLIIIFSPFYLIFNKDRIFKDSIFFAILILILFFRVFSEPIVFPTLFDFYFFSIILILGKNHLPKLKSEGTVYGLN
ncbi:MAG: hypothetical protein CFE25_01790 [Chitinophagaceae bacterium BSSC1]|nr:MAG: hypothetical protein CFE25_01790 [Chitinophagaceae bacterium BSSC1]